MCHWVRLQRRIAAAVLYRPKGEGKSGQCEGVHIALDLDVGGGAIPSQPNPKAIPTNFSGLFLHFLL